MAANWLRRTDTLDTLRVNNTILTGTSNNNGLTLYQANLQYPALTTSTSVSSNQLSTTTTIGNLNATPQYSYVSSQLNIQAKNPTQPISSVILTINDISQASIATYIIGDNSNGFGGFPAAANRAYRYGYFKTGQIAKLENFAFVRSTNAGQAGMAEITGDVNFYFNMQVARNIYTAGSLNVVTGGATVSSLVPTASGKSFINGIGGGLLGIGTTNPSYVLDVAGTARFSGGITAQQVSTSMINVAAPGMTIFDTTTSYPYENFSYTVGGTTIVYNITQGTAQFNPVYTRRDQRLSIVASAEVQPVSTLILQARDTVGSNALAMYTLGNGYADFGGSTNAANRTYRFIFPKTGPSVRVEAITFVSGSIGAAGVAELTGDVSIYTNLHTSGNIRTSAYVIAQQNGTNQVGLYASGQAVIGGTGSVVVANPLGVPLSSNTRILVTPTGPPTAVGVTPGTANFTINGTVGTVVNWMIIYN